MISLHKKSRTTILLDISRNLVIIVATGFAVFLICKWSWVVALIVAISVYIVALNLFGLFTLPLYALVPEKRRPCEISAYGTEDNNLPH